MLELTLVKTKSTNQKDMLVRPPQQQRSRETMERIMETLEVLLHEKSFDRITLQELAQKSGAGASSIYARFKDKQALIMGTHERLRDRAFACMKSQSNPRRWKGKSVEQIVCALIDEALVFYGKHWAILRAALFVDEASIRQRQAESLHFASEQYSKILAPFTSDQTKMDMAVDASCRIFASVMYSRLMFGEATLVRTPVSDEQLKDQLNRAILCLILDAVPASKR